MKVRKDAKIGRIRRGEREREQEKAYKKGEYLAKTLLKTDWKEIINKEKRTTKDPRKKRK